jgi:hypothetical protein
MPVIDKYIGHEYMIREGRKTIYKLVEPEKRETWLNNRRRVIISDLRSLEQLIHNQDLPSLFGPNSFIGAEELFQTGVATDKSSFGAFLHSYNRCFIESIENYGKTLKNINYFWNEIKNNYPDLWEALYRLKIYRNKFVHAELNKKLNEDFNKFIKKDLEGRKPKDVPDLEFYFQQCILDGLLLGIQIESNNLSS